MSKNQTEDISKSMAKRLQRQKEVAAQKRNKKISSVVTAVIIIAIVAVIGSAVGWNVYKMVGTTVSSSEFSKCIDDNGFIKQVDVTSAVTVADYENHVVPMSEVAATDEEVQADIDSTLEANQILSTDASVAIADGDKVNIDYVGTMDGVEFEGGNSNGEGADLTIGSGQFVDTFEEQLIGHKAGEKVTVNVTFPEDYQSPDLAGKDASFAVTVNGIYVTPELTDEFVSEHLSEYAATAEEYRSYVTDKFYKQHLTSYIETYLKDNSTVNSYPSDYVKNLKQTLKYQDEQNMEYYNQMYQQYTGTPMYNTVYDMSSQSWFEYEKTLKQRAKDAAKDAMVYQAIYQKAGLTIDTAAYLADLDTQYGEGYSESLATQMGQGYILQQHIREVVTDYLVETMTVQ